jgi:leucyl-tRNA synthetase
MNGSGAYDPKIIEKKWQEYWEKTQCFCAQDFANDKKKTYLLVEFPYPSGEGLHVGHCRSYSAMDAIARKRRMEGENVLFPIGWDAFGLPTENYAIKHGIQPEVATQKNVANFTRQLKNLGLSFDWLREINTTDPEYYRWTQWIFIQLFKKDLAYQAQIPVNWCPKCLIGLANEEVIGGNCERCGAQVSRREIKQWVIRITAYADRLISDLDAVDYLEKIKIQQKEWIGRSEGAQIDFSIDGHSQQVKIFTTRIDTVFGVTAIVLAPEHKLVGELKDSIRNFKEVENYIARTRAKSEFERSNLEKERTGMKLEGVFAVNPANGQKIEVWLGDYVIGAYGGGAVMMVPAHDRRDYDFAKKYGLPTVEVIAGGNIVKEAFTEYGTLINSKQFNGLESDVAKTKITEWLARDGKAGNVVHYKLRDWIFSRQHYWGEPIPIVHCPKCGAVPVPEEQLPLKLPYVEKYQPTQTGESPLSAIGGWVNTTCPICGGPAKRETDTMPNWAGSNWYYMRYCDPRNNKELASPDKLKYWLPVDWYNGGMEHTTLHLLYSRFIYKFLYDIGAAPTSEPYKKRTSQGMILAANNEKMSKSRGNVVNPDDIIKEFGADTLRVYEMFMGPFDQAIAWSEQGVKGARRFLGRIWYLISECDSTMSSEAVLKEINKLIKKISDDIEKMKFNTAVAAFMEFLNFAEEHKTEVGKDSLKTLALLLSPFVPHLCEELWEKLGSQQSLAFQKWPVFDPALIQEETVEIIVQINGKMRCKIAVPVKAAQDEVEEIAKNSEIIKKWLGDGQIKKTIYVPGRLINFVV